MTNKISEKIFEITNFCNNKKFNTFNKFSQETKKNFFIFSKYIVFKK